MLTLPLFLAVAGMLAQGSPSAQEATDRAAAIAERVDEAYEQVRMTTLQTRYDGATDDVLWQTRNEFARKGDKVVTTEKVLQDQEAQDVVGKVVVVGGSPEKRFALTKQHDDTPFGIEAYGKTPNFSDITTSRARPVFSPYQIFNVRLADFLRQDDFKPISTDRTTFLGHPVTEIVARLEFVDEDTGEDDAVLYRLFFHPESWVFEGFEFHRLPRDPENTSFYHRITYEDDTAWPPRIKRLEIVEQHPDRPGERMNPLDFEITSLSFDDIDDEQFTLAAFGVEEPAAADPAAGTAASTVSAGAGRTWPWLVGVGLVLLGIVLAVVAARRRPAADAA